MIENANVQLIEIRTQSNERCVFFFNDTATTEIYTLPLHDALPISSFTRKSTPAFACRPIALSNAGVEPIRSEEHTSELHSQSNLVCRLLLENNKHLGGRGLPLPLLANLRQHIVPRGAR